MGKGVVHFFVGFFIQIYSDSMWFNIWKACFLKFFFLAQIVDNLAAIGSVNITWWKLDILPGYSTTPNPTEENSMKKRQQVKINYTFVIFSFFFLFFLFHFQADDYGINRLHHIWSDFNTYLCLRM